MCILLVKNQGCFHPSKIVKAKIIKIFIITPQKNNTLTTIAYCRIARKKFDFKVVKTTNYFMPFNKNQNNTKKITSFEENMMLI